MKSYPTSQMIKPGMLIPILAGLVAVTSCSERSFTGLLPDYTDVSEEVPVRVYVGSGTADVRGAGDIDSFSDFEGKSIYVYAFSAVSGVSYDSSSEGSGAPAFLMRGRRATLDGKETLARWADEENICYPSMQWCDYPYDFFACYMDDIPLGGVTYSSDRVTARINIDGRNDIMVSRADPPEGSYFCYSSARKYINPVFKFSHALVRLRFKAKPGLTPGISQEVGIEYLSVRSRTGATLTVASRDGKLGPVFDGAYSSLYLRNADGSEYSPETIYTRSGESEADGIIYIAGGASLLVSPEDVYEVNIGLSQPDVSGGAAAGNIKKIRLPSGSFLGGNSYDIVFEIFGRNNISVGVVLTPWSDPIPFEDLTDDQRPED